MVPSGQKLVVVGGGLSGQGRPAALDRARTIFRVNTLGPQLVGAPGFAHPAVEGDELVVDME
jgi:hypothetical protein